MGRLAAGMTVRIVGTSDVGTLVMVREAAQTCVIKLARDGTLRKNVPLDDVREEKADGHAATAAGSPIRLAASDKPLALPPSMGGASGASGSPAKRGGRLEVGDRVQARYKKGTKWFDGTVARVRSDGTYDVEYDDGDVETKVDESYIERVAAKAASPTKTLAALSPGKATKAPKFAVGESVQARYKKGTKWFAGKITKAHSDGSYDIRYDDGDVETRVDASYIQADRAGDETDTPRDAVSPKKKSSRPQIGDKVKARYKKGAKLYAGVITRVHSDGTYDLKYEDGDTESRVEAKYIEFPESGTSDAEDRDTHSKKTQRKSFRVCDEVRAKYKGGKKLYPGTIKRVHSDGTYDIKYEDGDVETRVEADLIEEPAEDSPSTKPSSPKKTSAGSFSVGDSVKARYKGGAKLFSGKIQKVRSDGTYDVKYDDGDVETGVEPRHIELVEPASARSTESELEVGDRVKARYKKGTKLFPGKITKVHSDGSYDIRYDDGDTEARVQRELIESDTKTATSSPQRRDQLQVGDAVKARYKKGSKYYAGKITRVRTDGTFDVEYEDGDVETRVQASDIEVPEKVSSPKKKRGFEVDDAVMARYKRGAKLYRGVVKRVRADGTYDIKYEDGDVETAVELEFIESDGAADTKDRDESRVFKVGDAIKAQYKNSTKWYPGRVSRVRTDGTYDVDYDDGEKESHVDSGRIERVSGHSSPGKKPKELQVGDHVKARYKGGKKLYAAVVTRVRTDGTYDLKYEDGDTESHVGRDMIESSDAPSETTRKREFRVGDSVVAKHKTGKKLYRGKITRVRANGTCDIRYQDGTDEDRVPIDKVQLDDGSDSEKRRGNQSDEDETLAVGDSVQAYFKKGKKLFSGKITRRHSDDTYDIRYDDGDVETRVPRNLIVADSKKKETKQSIRPPKLGEGAIVMSKHKRSSKKTRGRISRVRTDGTFDIEFNDGETATRVEADMIELVEQAEEEEDDRKREKTNKGFDVGDKVKARYKKGTKWFTGTVTKARTDGTYDIKYDDGDVENSVAPDHIESVESKTKKMELRTGDEVTARYKNGSKWYNGVVKKVRTDGTFDIRYEDGDMEERVKPENVRAVGSPENTPRDLDDTKRSPSKKSSEYEKGDAVEADYMGNGRYRRGIIARAHSDNTFDIEYDNGDSEKCVSVKLIRGVNHKREDRRHRKERPAESDSDADTGKRRRRRSRSRSGSGSSDSDSKSTSGAKKKHTKIVKGSRVTLRKALDSKARRIGRVKKTHSDGTCDIQYKNGDVSRRIALDALLVCSDAESSNDDDQSAKKGNHRFQREQAVLACWKRSNRMSKPVVTDRWEEATILATSDGGKYSIRYRNGEMEEDVPEEAIKPRSDPVVEPRPGAGRDDSRDLSDSDVLFLLEQLAMTLYEEGELRKKPRVRTVDGDASSSSSRAESDTSDRSDASTRKAKRSSKRSWDPIDKALRTLFDNKCLQRYQDRFEQHDPDQSGRIPKSKIIDIVEDLCSSSSAARADDTTVRRQLNEWFSTQDSLRTHSKFPFKTLMIAFAMAKNNLSKLKIRQNMAHALEARFASHHESKKQLEMWQQKLGFRTFETLQRFFHDSAIPRMYPAQVRVSEIASIFDQVTRSAVSNKPLDVYLKQMQLLPHHALLLPEFMCCYYQLYGSADANRAPVWVEQLELRPVAFVASCLFSNGDPCCQRHGDLVRRLCIGRTPSQVDLIMRFREAFESLQNADEASSDIAISTSHLNAFASKVVGDPSVLEPSILALRKRTATVSLVEIFSSCGHVIDELTSAPTVTNAIEKLRLRTESSEVRRIITLVRNMCLKVLRFPNNPDYWRVRSDSAAFHQKLGRFDGATSLIEAVGFVEYGKSHFELRGSRTVDGKRSGCLPKTTLDTLREKCSELDAELAVMDGVESVISILQRIAKQRELDTPLSLEECEEILKHLVVYIETVLKNPKDSRCWRIRESNKTFQRQIGYLPFCGDLMASIGYDLIPSSQGNVYVLRGTGLGNVDTAKPAAVDASLSNFAFSSVSQQMEWFLWRRKQEIEALLQDDMEYLVQMLGSSTSAPTRSSQDWRGSRLGEHTKTPSKMYPYGRNALDTFNKTATQKAQIAMMKSLFESLDTKKRGYLLTEDLHRDRRIIPRWATFEAFDLDKDSRVDFADFVGALGPGLDHSFDPLSVSDFVPFQRMSLSEQVSTLVGRLRVAVGLAEATSVVDSVMGFLVRIIDQPNNADVRTIPVGAPIVVQAKRTQAIKALLDVAGYRTAAPRSNPNPRDASVENAFVLEPHPQVRFQTSKPTGDVAIPLDAATLSRLQLIVAMLGGHARLMLFPSISDVGAVARGLGELRPFQDWIKLTELATMCLDNILTHPEDEDRYRQLKTTTSTFSSVAAKVSGGVQLFLSIGFRETDHGTLLLPDSVTHGDIKARKLEINVGCQVLRILEKLSTRGVEDDFPHPSSPPKTTPGGVSSSSDPAVDYYKRKALAAELAREEALQKSAHLEKQLEIVAKTQSRRSRSEAPLTPSSRARTTSQSKARVPGQQSKSATASSRRELVVRTARSLDRAPSIEAEILAEFSPRNHSTETQEKVSTSRQQLSRAHSSREGRNSQRPNTSSAKPAKSVQRRQPSTPSSTIHASRGLATLHESSLAMDCDAGSRSIVLRSSNSYLERGALVRIGTEHRDLTEERLIVDVDTGTFPNLTKVVLHRPLAFPHYTRDLVFILPPVAVNSGDHLTTSSMEEFILRHVIDVLIERAISTPQPSSAKSPGRSPPKSDTQKLSQPVFALAHTMETPEHSTIVSGGIHGEQLVLCASSFPGMNGSAGDVSEGVRLARDCVTVRKLRAVWDGLLIEFGGAEADRVAWRHLHAVCRRVPWMAMYHPLIESHPQPKGSASWEDFLEWLQCPLSTTSSAEADNETAEQLLALTVLRQHFRALIMTDKTEENGVFHSVPADDLIKRSSASLITVSAAPTEVRDVKAVQALFSLLEATLRAHNRHTVVWPEIVYCVRHGQILNRAEMFPRVMSLQPTGAKLYAVAAVVCAVANDVVFILRTDGLVEAWRSTPTGGSELISTSLALFYVSSDTNPKLLKAAKTRSLVEDQIGTAARALRDPEWDERQRRRVHSAVDGFLRSTSSRRVLLSFTADGSCLVVNATMLSESNRPHGGGLLYFHVSVAADVSLRPLRRLQLGNASVAVKASTHPSCQPGSDAISSSGVIEAFAMSSDGTTVVFHTAGKGRGVVWIASSDSGRILSYVDEFAWLPDVTVLFCTAPRSLVCVASTRTSYVSVRKWRGNGDEAIRQCVLPSPKGQATTAQSATISAIAATKSTLFAAYSHGTIAMWVFSQVIWESREHRVPTARIQQTNASIHQLGLFSQGYNTAFQGHKSSHTSQLVVLPDEDELLRRWDESLPNRSVRLALYLMDSGDVVDVAVPKSFSTHMLRLDVTDCVRRQPDLLVTPGFDRVLLEPDAVLRVLFVACEYRRDGVFAQKSIRELLDDIKTKRILFQTRLEMEKFVKAYNESISLDFRCYYRQDDSAACSITSPLMKKCSQRVSPESMIVGAAGTAGGKSQPRPVIQFWNFSPQHPDHGGNDSTFQRLAWEFEAFRIRRQSTIETMQALRTRLYGLRRSLQREIQKQIATAFESAADQTTKEQIADLMLVSVEHLCWLAALEARCCAADPVEQTTRSLFDDHAGSMPANDLQRTLEERGQIHVSFSPWSQRLRSTLPQDDTTIITLDDVLRRIRQWRCEFLSVESLCELIDGVGVLSHLIKPRGGTDADCGLDAITRTVITQHFSAFVLPRRKRDDAEETSRDADSEYHNILTFIPPRLVVEFILRSCDVGDRLDKCIDVIANRTESDKQQIGQHIQGPRCDGPRDQPELTYAKLLLRKRLRERVEHVEQRQTRLYESANANTLDRLVTASATQQFRRVLKTSLPSVHGAVSSVSVCLPAVVQRLGSRLAVDAEAGATDGKRGLTLVVGDVLSPTTDERRRFQKECAFYRRVQQWKTRELFLPVIPSASDLPVLRSEHLPGPDPAQLLVCESLKGWVTLDTCIHSLRDVLVSCSIVRWQSLVVFWCRQVLLGLAVLEDDGLATRSFGLDDLLVSPDGTQIRFGALHVEDNNATVTNSSIELFGRLVLQLCEAFQGEAPRRSETSLSDYVLAMWSQWDERVANLTAAEVLEQVHHHEETASDADLTRIMAAAFLSLQPRTSCFHPSSPSVLWTLAFSAVDEDAPTALAAELSWAVSTHSHLETLVLRPLRYLTTTAVGPLAAATLTCHVAHDFDSALSRTITLSTLRVAWAAEMKVATLRWMEEHTVIERIVVTSIAVFEKCLRRSQREPASAVVQATVSMLRNALDQLEATETLSSLLNEPTSQRLVFAVVGAICTMCGAPPTNASVSRPGPLISAALWRMNEAYLRELLGIGTPSNQQDSRCPRVLRLLQSLHTSVEHTVHIGMDSAGRKSPATSLNGIALWWRQQCDGDLVNTVPQRHSCSTLVGARDSSMAFDALVMIYQTLELRFNASSAATSSAPKFRLTALQTWFSPQFIDRKTAFPLVIAHDTTARVWRRLDMGSTLVHFLGDADDRIVFGALSVLDVYTRVLRYRPNGTEASFTDHLQFRSMSPAVELAVQLTANPLVTTQVAHVLARLVRALKIMGESVASAAISSRYGASGLRASDPVSLFCVTTAFLVNCLHGGDVSTRHWISSGLVSLILAHTKAKSLLFIKVVDANWIHHTSSSGLTAQRSVSGTASSPWLVFSDVPLAKVSPFELLLRELATHTASQNTLLIQHVRATSATFRHMIEAFGSEASGTAHLVLNSDYGKLSHAWEVIRDVDECDGTLNEKAQAVEYATAALAVWLSARLSTSPLPLTVEKICTTVWAWLITSWQYVVSRERTSSAASDPKLHHAVVCAGFRMLHAVVSNGGTTVAEPERLLVCQHDPSEEEPSDPTVLSAVLRLLGQTAMVPSPSKTVSSLFRSGIECVMGLVAGEAHGHPEQRALSVLKHGFSVSGVAAILRMDPMLVARCCGDGDDALSVRYATLLKTRLWAALLRHGDREIAREVVEDELLDHWLVHGLDNDFPLQNHHRDDDEDDENERDHSARCVVNARLEVLAQLEILLHACHFLGHRDSLAVHLLVGGFSKSVLAHRAIHQEKQRVLTYAQFLRRTHPSRHSPLTTLAARMVATAKRFVQLVCCLSVDTTSDDIHSAVLAALETAGVPSDVVEWHQHSEPVGGAATRESRRVGEFWETWPEASATLGPNSRRAFGEQEIAVLARPESRKTSSPTRIQNNKPRPTAPPPREPRKLPTASSATPVPPREAPTPADSIPLDELLVCLDSDVAELESVFQRHAVAGNGANREKFMAPNRVATAMRECLVPPMDTTLPSLASSSSPQLPFSGFLVEYARRSGLEALWKKSRGRDVVFVRLGSPTGRWTSLPKTHWGSVQRLVANERSLSSTRLVEILLSLHRGLFSRHELTEFVAKTLCHPPTNDIHLSQQQLRGVVAAVYEEASRRPAVQRLVLQPPTSPTGAPMVPVSPVRISASDVVPTRMATLSPQRGGEADAGLGGMRESVVQTLVSIDVESARALQHQSTREERRPRRTSRRADAEGGEDDSLGSDAYSPFSERSGASSSEREPRRRRTKRHKQAEKKETHKNTADAKRHRGGEDEKKVTLSDSERSNASSRSSSSARRRGPKRWKRRPHRSRSTRSSSGSSSPAPRRCPSREKRPDNAAPDPVRRPDRLPTMAPEDATLRRVFAKYDADGDGAIGFADLRRVVGPSASGAELQRWIAEKDRRGVGAVDFADFCFAFSTRTV